MWELIRLNKRKSMMLFIIMGIVLIALGYVVGAAWMPPDGGLVGVALALTVWGIWSLVSYFAGDNIMLTMSGAKEVKPDVHPQLFNVVEEMKIAAGLPKMPKVYIIDSEAPNAFAVGRKPDKTAIAVTAGLLAMMNRDELQGVVAHETGHINNRDVQFMTFAGIMLGTIAIISHIFLRGMFFGGGSNRRYKSGNKDSGQGQIIILAVALIFAILAPIMVRLLYLALSRKREYLADATAARLTRYPEGLASALEKLSHNKAELPRANKTTAPMYIVNPLKPKGRELSNLTSTHPPLSERIKILRAMSQGASLANYQAAYDKVTGKGGIVPASGMKDTEQVSIRQASKDDSSAKNKRSQKREAGDIMRAVNKYLFMGCAACGLKMKIPPDFKKDKIECPRCGNTINIPVAELAAAGVVLDQVENAKKKSDRN